MSNDMTGDNPNIPDGPKFVPIHGYNLPRKRSRNDPNISTLHLPIPKPLRRQLSERAALERRTQNQAIIRAIEIYLASPVVSYVPPPPTATPRRRAWVPRGQCSCGGYLARETFTQIDATTWQVTGWCNKHGGWAECTVVKPDDDAPQKITYSARVNRNAAVLSDQSQSSAQLDDIATPQLDEPVIVAEISEGSESDASS